MRIPIYKPMIGQDEEALVVDAIRSTWISSKGEYIDQFEAGFASFVGAEGACSVSNGTVAVHLCLAACGIAPGDEVIVPAFTYVASVNPILQMGAVPVFVDSLDNDVHVDPVAIEAAITPKTKAVIAVHLYGGACDIEQIRAICDRHGLKLIEDAAEAAGTFVGGKHAGTFGDASSFSFFGNKTITTGEGGMVLARSAEVLDHMRHLKNQGVSATKAYWHDVVAYNYRMTNLTAAIGVAQLKKVERILDLKRTVAQKYFDGVRNPKISILKPTDGVSGSYWMVTGFTPTMEDRDRLRQQLADKGIETRPTFPVVCDFPHVDQPMKCPNARRYAETGFNLPSFPHISDDEQQYVIDALNGF